MFSEPEQEEVWHIKKLREVLSVAFVAGEITLQPGAKLRFDISHDIGIDELTFNAGGVPPSLAQAYAELFRKAYETAKSKASGQRR
jgi:hypothetical protein